MMKKIIVFIILFSNVGAFSQKVEFVGGLNYNIFYGGERYIQFTSNYTSEVGFGLRVAFENENENKFKWRAAVGFEKYSGSINVYDGGFGGGNRVDARIDKTIFTFTFYPLNVTLWNKLDLNAGIEASKTFRSNHEGTYTNYSSFSSNVEIIDLKKLHPAYNADFNFGFRGRMAYNFKISEKLSLSPQVSYFFGLAKEFKEFPRQTKSMRPFLGIGLKKKLF